MSKPIPSPFPWFGGKRKVAAQVWQRFGAVTNYVEPFFGSGAVLLGRPQLFDGTETINDLDGFVANFWRSIKLSPEATAQHADNPVNENDLHARHVWLVKQIEDLRAKLDGDPDFHDPKIAGYWVWGVACWIGSGFCSGNGPWWTDAEGKLVHLGDPGRGVKRKLVHLGNPGQGVNRQLVHLGNPGQGGDLVPYFNALADRLRRVRVASGDWARVCGPSVTSKHGMTAVFLDPPYSADRCDDVYRKDSADVAHDVREWAIENGKDPLLRIALCGYEGEHEMPKEWETLAWNAGEGFGGQAEERSGNGKKERVWFSPACLGARQASLLDRLGAA